MRLWDQFEALRKGEASVNQLRTENGLDPIDKAGARISAADLSKIQDMHDTVYDMCGDAHCRSKAEPPNDEPGRLPKPGAGEPDMLGPATQKRGARHSASDMMHFKAIHDACCAMGAKCDA